MPRLPRIDIPGIPQHVVVRGHNRSPCFFGDAYHQTFLRLLSQAAAPARADIHAYVLMSNHVHLLVTGHVEGSISRLMHSVAHRYARLVNRAMGRTGTLFEGRFRSSLVQSEAYFLRCMRDIECNPVRAGMTRSPREYPWSSHLDNMTGEPSGLLTAHAEYLRLGIDKAARAHGYERLFDQQMSNEDLHAIRENMDSQRVLGDAAFLQAVGARLGRNVGIVRQGRPKTNLAPF